MDPFSYPLSHFRLMSAIAAQLAIKSIQMLEHSYDYQYFGSWWFSFQNAAGIFRVGYEGRENLLLLLAGNEPVDRLLITKWEVKISEKVTDRSNSGAMAEQVLSLVEKAC